MAAVRAAGATVAGVTVAAVRAAGGDGGGGEGGGGEGGGGDGGGEVIVKLLLLVALPPGVVTRIGPVVAFEGTVVLIWVSLATVYVAAVLLKATTVAPVKPLPVIATFVPTVLLLGVKLFTAGVTVVVDTTKLVLLLALPNRVETLIGPVVAPLGTTALTLLSLRTANDAFAPLKVTAVAVDRFGPEMVTTRPIGALDGVKLVIVGRQCLRPFGSPRRAQVVPATASRDAIERSATTLARMRLRPHGNHVGSRERFLHPLESGR